MNPKRTRLARLRGAPPHILACYDYGAHIADRWTVLYSVETAPGYFLGRDMSDNPFHPQGVGLLFELPAWQLRAYRDRNRHRLTDWTRLPPAVRMLAEQDGKQ